MAEVVIQAQSTLFDRRGNTYQYKRYRMTPALENLLGAALIDSRLPANLAAAEQQALLALLQQNSEIIPGGLTLFDIQDLDPTLFPGAATLQAIYEKDPFSDEYEDETEALYSRSFAVARSAAQTGPVNIRGGTARQGFELAELGTLQSINRFREVWQNQLAMAQLVLQASQIANAAEAERRNSQLRAQQQQAATEQGRTLQTLGAAEQVFRNRENAVRTAAAGVEFFGIPEMETAEVIQGQGFQGGVTTGFGMTTWR